MKYGIIAVISLISLTIASNALAKPLAPFSKKHYLVIKQIVWAADKAEVPRELMLALCWGEGWSTKAKGKNPTHIDGKGKNATLSHGICQVKLETAQFMDYVYKHKVKATRQRLEDNKVNAFYASKLIKYHLRENNNDWHLAVDAYNKGTAYGDNTKYVKHFKQSLAFIKKQVDETVITKGNVNVKTYQVK